MQTQATPEQVAIAIQLQELVIASFWASPDTQTLEELEHQLSGAEGSCFVVDVVAHPDARATYQLEGLPTTIFFISGEEALRVIGMDRLRGSADSMLAMVPLEQAVRGLEQVTARFERVVMQCTGTY